MHRHLYELHAQLESSHWWFRARRKIVAAVIDRAMATDRDGLIVDIGCGAGGMVAQLASRYRCLGIDDAPLAIDAARRLHPGCEYRLGEAPTDLSDVRDRAALILMLDVLEHIADDRAYLREIVAFARPGAQLLLTVPAGTELWSQHDIEAAHHRRYQADGLAAVWHGLPVGVRLLSYFNRRLYPLAWLTRTLGGRAGGKNVSGLWQPPPVINHALEKVFSGELAGVLRHLDAPVSLERRRGVSLIALLRKTDG